MLLFMERVFGEHVDAGLASFYSTMDNDHEIYLLSMVD